MLPAFGRQHRLSQKWPESMYLLDKKIYLKFHQIEKILSVPNRRVPNPGFLQNKDPILVHIIYWTRSCGVSQIPGKKTLSSAQTHTTSDSVAPANFGPFWLSALIANFGPFLAHLAEISDLRFWTLRIFYFSDFVNIFSYRADTSIPTTFVAICAVDQKPVAYLLYY